MGFGRISPRPRSSISRAAAAIAEEGQRISNVVYMGMGEPLLNLGSVLDSVRVLTAPPGSGWDIAPFRFSTVGIPSGYCASRGPSPR